MYTNPAIEQKNTYKNRKKTVHKKPQSLEQTKENRLDTVAGVATDSSRGHGPLYKNMKIVSGLI
jgi:hypothetical protein